VQTSIERIDDTTVKLSVRVDEAEFDRYLDGAFRKIASQVRIPGFRPGKAPRRVLEAQIGVDAARAQAREDAVPSTLAKAVRDHDLDIVATPKIEVTSGDSADHVAYDATCELRPVVTIEGWQSLRVELPALEVSDADVAEVLDYERKRHGTLRDAARPVAAGDQVTLKLRGERAGEALPGLDVDDWLYEVGRGWVAEGFDDRLIGSETGASMQFAAKPSGMDEPADFSVTVKRVQEMELPDLTDAWVDEHVAEFDTVEAWRASVRQRLADGRLAQARREVVERTTSALAALVTIEAPESMVGSDLRARVDNTVRQFQAQGIALEQWLSITGQTGEQFVEAMREQSRLAVKVDLALRAVVVADGIEVSDDDLEAQYARIASQVGRKASVVRRQYEESDAVTDLRAQIAKSRAIDALLHRATFVDPAGTELDNEHVLGHSHDDHDHDHGDHAHGDHDHAEAGAGGARSHE
jgi:trigger factor